MGPRFSRFSIRVSDERGRMLPLQGHNACSPGLFLEVPPLDNGKDVGEDTASEERVVSGTLRYFEERFRGPQIVSGGDFEIGFGAFDDRYGDAEGFDELRIVGRCALEF